jgi:pimeloyl-ACP methyl ester carboxylesterase
VICDISLRSRPGMIHRGKHRLALGLFFVAVCSSCSASAGSKVDIGGRKLFIDCRGKGTPTVILESGLTSDTSAWDDVIDKIAEFSHVCAYDRANNGQSDSVGLHTGAQNVADLQRLLEKKHVRPPYVLVAWSFGGPIARLYAARHPAEVVGMVLVDTDPEDYRKLGSPFVPDDVREKSYWASKNAEKLDIDATLSLVRAASTPGSFDNKPLVILTPKIPNSGNIGEGGSQGLPGPRVKELDALYLRLQGDLTNLSSDSRLMLVDDTGHCIQCDQPEIVVNAVREVAREATRS